MPTQGEHNVDEAGLHRLPAQIVGQANRLHLVMLVLTLLMVPGALRALEPIDMEAYDMESPELNAQTTIDETFASSEVIVAFLVTVRDPVHIDLEENVPRVSTSDGQPDSTTFPPVTEIIESGEPWAGIDAPSGGILNITLLREIDAKADLIRNHPINTTLKPLVNDVTGAQTDGVMTLPDIFRAFMANESILTRPSKDTFGNDVPPATDWSDCGELECLMFDDANLTQDHIDLASQRLVEASDNTFLRWLSLDRGFRADMNAVSSGPIGGTLLSDGTWSSDLIGQGRWSASASWLLIQLDRGEMTEAGWTMSWKDAAQETSLRMTDEGLVIGGFRLAEGELVLHPPNYDEATCTAMVEEGRGPCSIEWSVMELEGMLRQHDQHSISLQVGQGVNVEVNRELQASAGLIALMGLAIAVLLFVSLRRPSDVAIVMVALGGALLWMQGLIGHLVSVTEWLGFSFIARSQFSNLLPILVMALGIDDSLHALHRYKEERGLGRNPEEATQITVRRVGRAILLTSLTTTAAFAANLFSDIAALRSFGVEAACGIFAAFLLTGIWAPVLRMSVDQWLEARGRLTAPLQKEERTPRLTVVPVKSGQWKHALVIAVLALLLTVPAAVGMARLEGDFAVEDFLDAESDFASGVNLVNERFSDEGEPAMLLLEGDVLDPAVFAGIEAFRQALDETPDDVADKVTRTPDGSIDILALDEMVNLAIFSMLEDPAPFEAAGLNLDADDYGIGCNRVGAAQLPDLEDRDCLAFFYGFLSLNGVPGTSSIPAIPTSIVALYITPEVPLNTSAPWLDENGAPAEYDVMLIRFGITRPEHFPSLKEGLEEIWRDLSVFTNLSSGTYEAPGEATEEDPLTWVMLTGRPIIRYSASTAMQDEMQSSLLLGTLFVFVTLTIGLRSPAQAAMSLGPILVVVVWLYGLMHLAGASLNIVTVTIATISLGVGIDYCIHVTERYRESRSEGASHDAALHAVGGACGAALVGSAASDIAGFAVIATSPMGLFSSFGTFSATMIALSLIASLVLTTAGLGLLHGPEKEASAPSD